LIVERLMPETIIPVAAPALAAIINAPDDLINCTLLEDEWHVDNGVFPDWATWLATLGVNNVAPLRVRQFGDANLTIQAAISGLGATLSWYSLVVDDLKAGRLVRLLDQSIPSTLGFDLVMPQNRATSSKALAFRAWLLAQSAHQRLN
jgi:LysR family glycine cleavage system transcriptional activator